MDKLESLLDRLEKVTQHLEVTTNGDMNKFSTARSQFTSKGDKTSNASLSDYDELLVGPVKQFMTLSTKLGGDVKEQSDLVQNCFNIQRKLLELASTHSKPNDLQLNELITTYTDPIALVIQFKDKKRSSPQFNHLSSVAESILAMGWISVAQAPAPYVKNMQEAAEFFTNRVIKDFKDVSPDHKAWTQSLMSVWTELHGYIKQHHTTGLAWNAKGSPILPSGQKPTIGNVPPPPPPPMPASLPMNGVSPVPVDDSRGSLFAQLNCGETVTSGLRKVTNDMKTHKNPDLRSGPGIQPKSVASPKAVVKPATTAPTPVKELQGNKWVVEHWQNEQLEITPTEPKQTVYIFKCTGSGIQIKGKLNSIVLDSCKKTGLAFDHVISSVDVINCQSVQLQSMGQLQTVSIDKTDGCQVYLSEESKFADVITAKSSELNVLVPTTDGSFDEFPIPEQFKTKFDGKALHTSCGSAI